ncbi:MAG: hypothetical protein ACK56F_23885, partial [bacterium]
SKGLLHQPVLLSGDMFEQRDAVVNTRRCQEGPTHLLESLRPLTELVFESRMCDIEFIGACVRSGEVYRLVEVFAEASKRFPDNTRINHYHRCLLKDATVIKDSPIAFVT